MPLVEFVRMINQHGNGPFNFGIVKTNVEYGKKKWGF